MGEGWSRARPKINARLTTYFVITTKVIISFYFLIVEKKANQKSSILLIKKLFLSTPKTLSKSFDFVVLKSADPQRIRHQCKLHKLLKQVFSNFRKVVHQISSGATRNRKENLKTHILVYSIGGWTGGKHCIVSKCYMFI